MFSSRPEVQTSIPIREIFEVFAAKGFAPELRSDASGNPAIVCDVRGHQTQVLFYSMDGGNVGSMTLSLLYANVVPLEVLNAFNRDKRFLKYYRRESGGLVVEMDCSFGGGVSLEHIVYMAEIWERALDKVFETD